MKITIEANEEATGCEISIEMGGKLNAKYLPSIIQQLLKGISSHGKEAECAVVLGIYDYIEEDLEGKE